MNFFNNQANMIDDLIAKAKEAGVTCPRCLKRYESDSLDSEAIPSLGMCLACDHIMTDNQEWEHPTPSDGEDYRENYEEKPF